MDYTKRNSLFQSYSDHKLKQLARRKGKDGRYARYELANRAERKQKDN